MTAVDPFSIFHPLIRRWFSETVGHPTDVQHRAWPAIAAGRHVLITAPTGSGKTLAAFLWALNRLLTGELAGGSVRVVYVSPLKALNNDIARNLLAPLAQLKEHAAALGIDIPPVRVMTRSGDTPEPDRRRMTRHPPEILITTPESLNLLISSGRGRGILTGVTTVILDEIHAIAGDKRGTYLMTAVERLTLLSGEFQRIALSATVRPMSLVAEFVGGFERVADEVYTARSVDLIESTHAKQIEVRVSSPPNIRDNLVDRSRYPALVEHMRRHVDNNRSTLLFTNSRKTTEKVARLLNAEVDPPLAYSHHGSLSREVRALVEERFKEGQLSAIVATNSLELGIDIGDLDEVLLINAPMTINSGIQRVGRAGHGVGDTSMGVIYPTHIHGFVDAAVMAPLIAAQSCEALRPVRNPLDVLAQVIVAMCVCEMWNVDELYAFLKTSWCYQSLRRTELDLVVEMLAGRYADSHIRELSPRVRHDRVSGTITARKGARMLLYRGGGVIPDRGYYNIRLEDSGALIGSLDEEFVWERKIGDQFTLGTQAWRIVRITHSDVVVSTAPRRGMPPFWRAEAIDRDFHLAEKVGLFLLDATEKFEDPAFAQHLEIEHHLDEAAVEELLWHLSRQAEATGPEFPHRYHVLIEHYADPSNTTDSKQVIVHAIWGGRILRPYGYCLSAAWEEKYGTPLEVMSDDEAIAVTLPHSFSSDELLSLVPPERVEELLRRRLESTGFFGARFRENAARSLLLPRKNFKKRMPLWLNRLRAQKLMEAVSQYDDFPVLLETWRSCLYDAFDLNGLRARLAEVSCGTIKVTEVVTTVPSPFSSDVVFRSTDKYMYLDDTPRGGSRQSGLSNSLIQELLLSSTMRPRIDPSLARDLERKLQRTYPGYAPADHFELLDLLVERVLIPLQEWSDLLEAVGRDRRNADPGLAPEESVRELLEGLEQRAVTLSLSQGTSAVVAVERLPGVMAAFDIGADDIPLFSLGETLLNEEARAFVQERVHNREDGDVEASLDGVLSEFLTFYGPLSLGRLAGSLGLDSKVVDGAVERLVADGKVLTDLLLDQSQLIEVCDVDNLERLLRMVRAAQRPSLEPRPLSDLPLFQASLHGLTDRGETLEDLQSALERLFGFATSAAAWEADILPARLATYHTAWLDSLLQRSDLIWYGAGEGESSFCFRDWLDLVQVPTHGPDESNATSDPPPTLLPSEVGSFDLEQVREHSGLAATPLLSRLWEEVWQGRISNDTFASLRAGILRKFKGPEPAQGRRRPRFGSWNTSTRVSGGWYSLPQKSQPNDLLQEEEARRERIRQLFARHGVLFRERLKHEPEPFQWRRVLRTLRLMEFSGEALAGHFFRDISGLQFIDQAAFRALQQDPITEAIFWINAADPISPCGLGLEAWKGLFPSRIPSNHLVFRGSELVMVSRRLGSAVRLEVEPTDGGLPEILQIFKDLLCRQFDPPKAISVETINDEVATRSPYSLVFKEFGFVSDYRQLVLRRTFGPT